jgi:hypothetical protein
MSLSAAVAESTDIGDGSFKRKTFGSSQNVRLNMLQNMGVPGEPVADLMHSDVESEGGGGSTDRSNEGGGRASSRGTREYHIDSVSAEEGRGGVGVGTNAVDSFSLFPGGKRPTSGSTGQAAMRDAARAELNRSDGPHRSGHRSLGNESKDSGSYENHDADGVVNSSAEDVWTVGDALDPTKGLYEGDI